MPRVRSSNPWWAILVAACWYSCTWPQTVLGAPSSEVFTAASRAFEAGDYLRALELFVEARDAGAEDAAVHYNIGVCNYRLGRYPQSEANFRSLATQFPQMRDLAEYNLGLALLAQERTADARTAFVRASRSNDPTLAVLAGQALDRLGTEPERRSRWLGSADVGLGHDDNVALIDDTSLPAGQTTASAFTELFAFASGAFATPRPSRLDVSGYVVRYPEAGEFNQNALRVGGAFEWSIGAWRLAAGPHYNYGTLDGDGFEQRLGFDVKMTRPLSDRTTFEWRFMQDDVKDLEPAFSFIDGSRQWLRIGIEHRGPRARLRAGYDFEHSDRVGASVTADRHRVTLMRSQRINSNWALDMTGSYRTTRHDRLASPSQEQLTELSAIATRDLAAGWLFRAEYYWADNDSDIAVFLYDRSRVLIGISRPF